MGKPVQGQLELHETLSPKEEERQKEEGGRKIRRQQSHEVERWLLTIRTTLTKQQCYQKYPIRLGKKIEFQCGN